MKKRLFFITTLILVLLIALFPVATAYSLTSSGVFYQDINSGLPGAQYRVINGYVKYNYHPGALLSRYYFIDSANSTYMAYPIRAPIGNYGDEVNGWGGYEIPWTSAMGTGSKLTDPIPQCYGAVIAFRNTCNGPVTGYGTIRATYSMLFRAYAAILRYGYGGIYDQSGAFGLGTSTGDHAARYYATNMAIQRLSTQSLANYDIGGYGTDGVTDLRVTNFAYYLENEARKVLCGTPKVYPNLIGSVGTPVRASSTYINVPITISIPGTEVKANYYDNTDFYWADLSGMTCPNAGTVTSTLSSFWGAGSVTANLQIASSSIKGGERIAYYIKGKAASQEALGKIFITSGSLIQAYILSDPSFNGSTTVDHDLNQVFVAGYLPNFDVQTTGITCNASYNAGNTGTVSVTYKNNSALPAVNVPISLSATSPLGAPFTITNPNQTISELQAGASTTVIYNVKANTLSGNATATFTAKIGYNTGGSTRFNETNYSNNVSTKTTIVYSLPDLVVSNLTSDKNSYEANELVTITAEIKNTGSSSTGKACLARISYDTNQLLPVDAGDKAIPVLAPNGTQTVTLTFTARVPILEDDGTVPVTVKADATGLITELNESNNSRTVYINTKSAKPDFSCEFNVDSYIAGQDAVVTVRVANSGLIDNPTVPVRLYVDAQTYDEMIAVPVGENLAVFRVTMPDAAGTVTLRAVVDPDNTIPEYDEGNNERQYTATVAQVTAPTVVDTLEDSLERLYLQRAKQMPTAPDTADALTHTWQEWRYENWTYVLHEYTATLAVNFGLQPDARVADPKDTIESGFGLEQQASVALETNYDHPEKLVGIQNVWLTYPETLYGVDGDYVGYYEEMMPVSTRGELEGKWSYPDNPTSVLNMPLHYIPLWFPDDDYTVLCTAWYGWTPNGQIKADVSGSVTVLGDMYDRITAVGW